MPHRTSRSNRSHPQPITYTKEHVLRAIESAFGALTPPTPDEVFTASFEASDSESKEPLRTLLCEQRWCDISVEDLNLFWSHNCYLTPQGALQLLAALLWRSTHGFGRGPDNDDPAHATIYMVLNGGPERIPQLTPQQLNAVNEFLGLYMDPALGRPWIAAVKLRQWGTPGHPATALGKAFDEANRHYTYPPLSPDALELDLHDPDDADEWQQRQALLTQLLNAFDETPYPPEPPLAIGWDEGAEYDEEFRGTNWKTLHPNFLNRHYAALSFFTPDAFRYFLPAYMQADLHDQGGNWDLIFHLTYMFQGNTYDEHMAEKHERFNAQERKVVLAYLRLFGRYEDIPPRLFDWWDR